MGNRFYLNPMKMENLRTGITSYGFHLFDDYGECLLFQKEPPPENDLECLCAVIQMEDPSCQELLEALAESQSGIVIGGSFYSWEEIKDCF